RDFEEEHIKQVIIEMRQELSGDLVTTIDEPELDTEDQPGSKAELEERLRLLESKLAELVGAAGTG
ncbi:MAG: hypothetical protein OEQ74_06035, partial [Gammaproteobacteria bacterium]|nr:hypothetical protein [Gammaproteobacteria bacterium]